MTYNKLLFKRPDSSDFIYELIEKENALIQ